MQKYMSLMENNNIKIQLTSRYEDLNFDVPGLIAWLTLSYNNAKRSISVVKFIHLVCQKGAITL